MSGSKERASCPVKDRLTLLGSEPGAGIRKGLP